MEGLIEFVSGFSAVGHEQYGWRLVKSAKKYLHGHPVVIYTHDMKDQGWLGIEQREQDIIDGLPQFIHRTRNSLEATGSKDPGGVWKRKEIEAGYSYRYDANKFCRMVFTMYDAIINCKLPYMVWLDGDCVVRQKLPKDFIARCLPKDEAYAYLGRPGKYTETGFLFFDVQKVKPILKAWVDYYKLGTYKKESEWHSAWLFDRAREKFPLIQGHNLTPKGKGHVIHQCWVGLYFDHLKGKRKFKGRSPEAK